MNKCKKNIPNWLINLPSGLYTIYDLVKITKNSRVNIIIRMKVLEVELKKVKQEGSTHKAVNMYFWKGAKYYLQKQFDEKINKIEENND